VYYSTVQSAYDAAVNGDIIRIQSVPFSGNLNFNSNISLVVKGGYAPSLTSQTGYTTINGNMVITSGTVSVENLILQ